jgi:hypothetical protein
MGSFLFLCCSGVFDPPGQWGLYSLPAVPSGNDFGITVPGKVWRKWQA